MKFKKIILVAIFLLALLTVSAVNAEDALSVEEDTGDTLDVPVGDVDILGDDEDEEPYEPVEAEIGDEDPQMSYELPDEIIACNESTAKFSFADGADGTVSLYIDDEYWTNEEVGNDFVFSYNGMGTHQFKFVYNGNSKYKTAEVTKTYTISKYIVKFYDYDNYVYGKNATLDFQVPDGLYPTLTVNVNGKKYTCDSDGGYSVEVSDLKYGSNTIEYGCDEDTYGKYSASQTINAEAGIIFYDGAIAFGDDRAVSLTLPYDVNGKLVIYKLGEYDVEMEDYEKIKIGESSLSKGYAEVTLKNLDVGEYDLYAQLECDDENFAGLSAYDWGCVILPKIIYSSVLTDANRASLKFTVSPDNRGVLTVSTRQWDDDEEDYIYTVIKKITINGNTAEVKLPKITDEIFTFNINYTDENGYIYEDEIEFNLVNLNDICFIEEFEDGTQFLSSEEFLYLNFNIPNYFEGVFKVYVDDKLIEEFSGDISGYEINISDLKTGKHTLKLTYDDLKITESHTFEISDVIISIPDELNVGSDSIEVRLGENLNGTVEILLDGKEYKKELADWENNYYYIDDMPLKTYKVTVNFYDNSNKLTKTETNNVELKYSLGLSVNEEYAYGEENIVFINIPHDIQGDLSVKINGKTVKWLSDGYSAYVNITGFKTGYYEITAQYKGDKKYYPLEESGNFEVVGMISCPEGSYYYGSDPISLELPGDASGNLVIVISNITNPDDWEEEYLFEEIGTVKVPLVKGKAKYSPDNLAFGYYHMELSYDGNDYYVPSKESNVGFRPNIEIENDDIYLNQSTIIKVTLPKDAKGVLRVNISLVNSERYDEDEGTVYDLTDVLLKDINVKDGKAEYVFKPSKLGLYIVNACYIADGNTVDENDGSIRVMPLLTIPDEFVYNRTSVISLELPKDATGDVTVIVNATTWDDASEIESEQYFTSFKKSVENGAANIDLKGIDKGDYKIYISYNGNYGKYDEYFSIFVAPSITLPHDIKKGESGVIEFELDGAEGEIEAYIGGIEQNITVVNGKATIVMPKTLEKGHHDVIVRYKGNDGYNFTGSFILNVKNTPEITITNNNPTTTKNTVITVALDDRLAAGNVTLTYGDKEYTSDFENGVAAFDLGKLSYGKHDFKVRFNGNGKYAENTKDGSVDVFYDVKITAKNMNLQYSAGNKFTVKVYGKDGKIAKNTWVIFKIKGKQVAKLKTDKKGEVTFKPKQTPGNYKVSITALGKTVTKNLKVKQILTVKKVTVKKSAKKLVLTATLSKVNKKYLKGKTITFKFNGKKYTAKTNKKGIAKVTVKKAVLKKLKVGKKITYQATYLKNTVKKSVKVKK